MGKKILLVDDDENIREFLGGFLKELGYEIDEAANLQEALTKLGQYSPDLVLLDVNLPDSRGSEGLKRVRAVSPTVKVLMVTGDADSQLEEETKALGALGYLTKPFLMEGIQKTVEHHLKD